MSNTEGGVYNCVLSKRKCGFHLALIGDSAFYVTAVNKDGAIDAMYSKLIDVYGNGEAFVNIVGEGFKYYSISANEGIAGHGFLNFDRICSRCSHGSGARIASGFLIPRNDDVMIINSHANALLAYSQRLVKCLQRFARLDFKKLDEDGRYFILEAADSVDWVLPTDEKPQWFSWCPDCGSVNGYTYMKGGAGPFNFIHQSCATSVVVAGKSCNTTIVISSHVRDYLIKNGIKAPFEKVGVASDCIDFIGNEKFILKRNWRYGR